MIGIVTAIPEEFEAVKNYLDNPKEETIAEMTFCVGTSNERRFVLAQSGVGKVNAACCTQILIDRYNVDGIINLGVGGALNGGLTIGDIVISTDAFQYDMDATSFGFRRGEIPYSGTIFFEADKELINKAEAKAIENDLAFKIGRVCTADLSLSNSKIKEELVREYDGYICDMEGAAVAQVASINGVPFLIIRSVSDTAEEEANESYVDNKKDSSDQGAKLLAHLLELL